MAIYDRGEREKDLLLKQSLESMPAEERLRLQKDIQTELARRGQSPTFMGKLGQSVSNLTNQFAQQGGLKPTQEKASELDDLIKLEKFKTEQELNKIKLDEAQKKSEYQTKLQQEYEGGTPAIPTAAISEQPSAVTPVSAVQSQENIPPQTIRKIVKKPDGSFEEKEIDNPAYKLYEKAQEGKITSQIKSQEESEKGIRISEQNVTLVSGALKRLAETYANAVQQGGAGNIARGMRSKFATTTGLGKQYPSAAALPGQTTEVIARMMPILTQQGDKPGSVRLVSTVFDKLLKTVPNLNTRPEAAKEMLMTTVKNMFGFAKAIKQMGITNEMVDSIPQDQLKNIGNTIENYAKSVELSPEEQQQLDMLLASVTAPIDSILGTSGQISPGTIEDGYRFKGGNPADSKNWEKVK